MFDGTIPWHTMCCVRAEENSIQNISHVIQIPAWSGCLSDLTRFFLPLSRSTLSAAIHIRAVRCLIIVTDAALRVRENLSFSSRLTLFRECKRVLSWDVNECRSVASFPVRPKWHFTPTPREKKLTNNILYDCQSMWMTFCDLQILINFLPLPIACADFNSLVVVAHTYLFRGRWWWWWNEEDSMVI